MHIIKTLFFTSFFLLFFEACSNDPITKPPLKEPEHPHHQQNSVIQIPVSINTQEIKEAIMAEIQEPLSSGISEKITSDIFALEEITKKQLIDKYKDTPTQWFNPIESSYKFLSKDITEFINKTFKTSMWVKHKIYLKDLNIIFEGSKVKIYTSYKVDISIDYEQAIIPITNAYKIKGLLDGTIEASINLIGNISIDENAKLHLKALEDGTEIKFTKIALPSAVNLLEILKVTKLEDVLTKRLLEEPINKHIFAQVEKQITKKQVDIKLAQRIQKLVYENSYPLALSKDLWLVPGANKISISQVQGKGGICSNSLSINVGLIAQPELITSITKPIINPLKSVPIVCEQITPKVYLYPSLNIKYDFIANKITQKLNSFINTKYPDSGYSISGALLYPSDTNIILSLDLIDKDDKNKIFSFYLSGIPDINTQEMFVTLKDLDYTLESKNALINTANWLLDEEIKNFIQENVIFNYREEFIKLSRQLSNIEHASGKKIITGKLNLIGVEDIFAAKDSLVIHALATGNISYKINLRK
ncbi:MAG: hypothetical protein ACI9TV_001024 [Sulfurimonas sp.]|jgi:hypothetical protein|uniref:DUF4403 family protein n=1 Tax=Sulfurimonas sp. TaxID=2022749 RepID=UPI0039E5B486